MSWADRTPKIKKIVLARLYAIWRYLLVINKRNAVAVNVLDFSDFVEVHWFGPLDATYPKNQGQLDRPPEFLTSVARIRKWRGFNKLRQKYEIDL